MSVRNLDKIFKPDRVALFGARNRPGNLGLGVLNNLLGGHFQGVVYIIDPAHEGLRGIPTYAEVARLPNVPDLALICSAAVEVPAIIRDCGRAGIKGVVVLSRGDWATREAGIELDRKVAEAASEFEGMRILGPNSLGLIVPRLGFNASHAVTRPKQGHLAFISESRALCNAVLDWATEEGIGFSCFVSIGRMLDVGFGDVIDYLSRDPDTRAIILYLQSVEHPRSFMSAARAFARSKPIVAYKAGRFDASAQVAALHTGAMVAEDAVYEAAFERAGVVRVAELDEVFDVAELLASKRLPRGPRLAIIGNAGGPAVIATDALLARGGTLAPLDESTVSRLDAVLPPVGSHANPVDLLDSAPPGRFVDAVRLVLDDPHVDGVLVIFATQADVDPLATAKVVADVSERSRKPVLAAWMGGSRVRAGIQLLNEAGMATHSTPEQAVRAFMHLVSYARNLETLYETPRDVPVRSATERAGLRRRLAPLLRAPGTVLDEEHARTFLESYAIPAVRSHVATSPDHAVALAERIGYPVVLKAHGPGIVHKFEFGGVALDVRDADAVRSAFARMVAVARRHDSNGSSVIVQRMAASEHSYEMILGAKRDPTFGAVIMLGMGGIAADVVGDRALGLPPLNERLARRMLESLRSYPMLCGYRGKPAIDQALLIESMIRFSCLVTDFPEIVDFDVNPLLATPDGVLALDAAAVVEAEPPPADGGPFRHLVIRPYPEEEVRGASTGDGAALVLRPVRPEDEPLWHALIANSSSQSIHLRFRSRFARSTHEMAVRYCAIDYEREIGIVAEATESGERALAGIAQMLADANHATAEFAVIVPDPWQRRGVGGLLLDYCLEQARRWGIETAIAETQPHNRAMLALFETRGFSATICLADSAVYLRKNLLDA